ncbi:hypothetical protein TNCV_3453731 [Trichonephila clavipes]|nr:hypothetical protein TNCV_3453731 [Trichonephila clavipes]
MGSFEKSCCWPESGQGIDHGFVTSSSPLPLKTRRVGERCTKSVESQTSLPVGVVVRRVDAAPVASRDDHGSKLRSPSPKDLV